MLVAPLGRLFLRAEVGGFAAGTRLGKLGPAALVPLDVEGGAIPTFHAVSMKWTSFLHELGT